jgi:hypothetical protein
MKQVDCKTRKWVKRGRGVNEIKMFIRQEKDMSECFVAECVQRNEIIDRHIYKAQSAC